MDVVRNNKFSWLVILLTTLTLSSCAVRLIAPYDAAITQQIVALQKQVDTLLLNVEQNIGTTKANYSRFITSYNKIQVDLVSLITQAQAIPKNELTVKQLQLLQGTINDLQKLHKMGFRTRKQVQIIQQTVNQSFAAILKLEYAKWHQ